MQILSWGGGEGGRNIKKPISKVQMHRKGGTLKLGINQHIMIDQ